jgi:uncharacterized protein
MHTLEITLFFLTATSTLACAESAASAPSTALPCAAVASVTGASGAKPAKAAHTSEELFTAIRAADSDTVDSILADDPTLASAHTPKGASAILVATFMLNPDQETFVKPSNNAVLRALLRTRPPLDVFDAAVAGDATHLAALLSASPELARVTHPAAGSTPLHLAAFADHTDAIEVLLAKGATLDAVTKNSFHNTPLVVAMLGDALNAATLLIAKGADVEVPEEGGFRALHIAAESGDARLVKLLLDHRAQIDAKSDDGTTPLGVAVKKGRDAIATLLRSRGAT